MILSNLLWVTGILVGVMLLVVIFSLLALAQQGDACQEQFEARRETGLRPEICPIGGREVPEQLRPDPFPRHIAESTAK